MATWIAHLRIGETLYDALPGFDETAFTFGNLAPDSGKPNADWSEFDPPKTVTHFLRPGEDEDKIHDLAFYREYVLPCSPGDRFGYSFAWAYFFHLLCDNLWSRLIGATTRDQWLAAFEADRQFVWTVKKDWYGLDHKYLRDHPDSRFWRIFAETLNPAPPLPFLNVEAFDHSMNYIREGYSAPAPERVPDRPYPYLREAVMNRYVEDAAAICLNIYHSLQTQPDLEGKVSALALLDNPLIPYPAPLGDSLEEAPYDR